MTGTNSDIAYNALCKQRKSVRAFNRTQIDKAIIEQMLSLAATAPSGGNMQPWKVHVLTGGKRRDLSTALKKAYVTKPNLAKDDYIYYPPTALQPYSERIIQAGADLYQSLSIERRDVKARRDQQMRNYDFHGAPVGLILTMDARLQAGSYVDMGIFISHILMAAESLGLATCAQASFISYADIVRSTLNIAKTEKVICGIALGYEDKDHPINLYKRPRIAIEDFVEWHDA